MSWLFEQISGKLFDSEDDVIGVGYSGGSCGERPDGVNNPSLEKIENVGPIPSGLYEADWKVEVHPKLGKYAIHLSPNPETRAKIIGYGRNPDSFFIHGDNINEAGMRASSDGCIVMSIDVRVQFWTSSDHDLEVVVTQTQGV